MIYYILYLLLSFLSVFVIRIRQNQKIYVLLISVLIILFFQSLRWRTGTDWMPYFDEFKYSLYSYNRSDFEPLYKLLNQFIRLFTDNYTCFLIFECAINLFFIISFLKYMPITNPMLGLVYFFVISIFPIRYTLASSIILCSYNYILNKKFIHFCLLIILAFLIHRTAIVFFFYLFSL